MHIGMLWFDNTPNITLKSKIEKAADYYRQKYHLQPNLCLVHPSMVGKEQVGIEKLLPNTLKGLTVRSYQPVLPGHLWIGIEDDDD
jgi:hypothetical protein